MERWRGKVAVVTGASSGIGVAIVKDLVRNGVKTVALARREDRLKEIQNGLPANQKSLMYPHKCDVTKEDDVKSAFEWIERRLGGVDILVNNAGIARLVSILEPNNSKDIRDTIDTNVTGLVFCTREAVKSMKQKNTNGHVFLINSIGGHIVPDFGPKFLTNVYPASKFAVTALTETLRQEFAHAGTQIKVTSISPGATDTEIFPPEYDAMKANLKFLESQDVSEALIYALSTRPHVQVHEIMLRPMTLDVQKLMREQK